MPAADNRPFQRVRATRLRFVPALICSALAAGGFLTLYYLTLGHLPRAFPGAYARSPVGVWADRLDLAQLVGAMLNPPYPSLGNWWLGFVVLGGALVGLGLTYALLVSWSTGVSTPQRGVAWGLAQFFALGLTAWTLSGLHPAVMRSALPDTGFFFLGWTGWAGTQLFVCWAVYGALLGSSYRAAQHLILTREQEGEEKEPRARGRYARGS